MPNHWFSNRKPAFRFEHSVDLVKNSGAIRAKTDHLMHSRGRYDNIKGFRIEWHFPSIALPELYSIGNPFERGVSLSILLAVPYQEPLVHLALRWTIPDIYADKNIATDPDVSERYKNIVPVVAVDGKVRLAGATLANPNTLESVLRMALFRTE